MSTPPTPARETPRLRLRPLGPGDVAALLRLLADERVVRHMLFPELFQELAPERAARAQPPRADPPQVALAVTDRASAELVGVCGLVLRPEQQEGELWYLLDPLVWGRGLATEAAGAFVDHAFGELALHRVWASCLPENPASRRVLEKLGFRREGHLRENLRIRGEWRDSYLYAVLASEWGRRPSGAAT